MITVIILLSYWSKNRSVMRGQRAPLCVAGSSTSSQRAQGCAHRFNDVCIILLCNSEANASELLEALEKTVSS